MYMSFLCSQYAQYVPLNMFRSIIKHQYKEYIFGLCTLLKNIYHQNVNGCLMIASFFYKTRQYRKVLTIVMYSISKLTPEKLCYSSPIIQTEIIPEEKHRPIVESYASRYNLKSTQI